MDYVDFKRLLMNTISKVLALGGIVLTAFLLSACSGPGFTDLGEPSPRSLGPPAPLLGAASTFALFGGGAGFTNAGLKTQILGDAGTTGASTMVSGFHSASFVYAETPLNVGFISGAVYTAPPQGTVAEFEYAVAAAADALAAFNYLAGLPDGTDPGAGQLGGLTLLPGTYKSAAGPFLITGSDLTLDAQGNPDSVWVFQMASTLLVGTPTSPQSVVLINGARAQNVYWQVGSAATINAAGGGSMAGTIIASAGVTFSTAGNETLTVLNGRALALFASITMVNTVINTGDVPFVAPVAEEPPVTVPQIVVLGSNAAAVVPVVAGSGFLNIENNGGLVTATENGAGTIAIVNNGGVLTATNTGNGLMTIHSDATGAVTVTNTGNGKVTVYATGAAAVTVTHTGDEDFVYPAAVSTFIAPESVSMTVSSVEAPHIVVTGSTAADVTPVVTGGGFVLVNNEGGHVAATQTGLGVIDIFNDGGVLTATNTGTGTMSIQSDATGAVTVTNTGTGNVTVRATGAAAIAIVHTGDEDFFYP